MPFDGDIQDSETRFDRAWRLTLRPSLTALLERIDRATAVHQDETGRLRWVCSESIDPSEYVHLLPPERLVLDVVGGLDGQETAAFLSRCGQARSAPQAWEQAAQRLALDIMAPMAAVVAEESEGEATPEQTRDALLSVLRARHDPHAVNALAAAAAMGARLTQDDAARAAGARGLPHPSASPEERLIADEAFHRRRLRKWSRRLHIHVGDVLRLVDPRRSRYLAPAARRWVAHTEEATRAFLSNAYAANATGTTVPLQRLAASARSRRHATLRAIIHAMDERRQSDPDIVPVFVTLIPEGEATPHAVYEAGRISEFDPHRWHLVQRRRHLSEAWHGGVLTPLRAYLQRRGRDTMGIWCQEGTKSGVLHRHILLWLHRDDVDVLCRYLTGGGWPTLETHRQDTAEDRAQCRAMRVVRTVDRRTGVPREDDWTMGPRRADATETAAFSDYRVNVRVLQEKNGDSTMSSIVNYVTKYVTKCVDEGEGVSDETRFTRAHEARSYGLLGLPRGIMGIWEGIATARDAPEGTLMHRLRTLILSRRDAEALDILIRHAEAWREADAAGRRLMRIEASEAVRAAPAQLQPFIEQRRRAARQRAESAIAAAPDSRLATVREPRVTRLGALYRATAGIAEVDGRRVRTLLREGRRATEAGGEAVRHSTARGETWAVTTHPAVRLAHSLPAGPADEVDERAQDAARAAAVDAVRQAIAHRAARRLLDGGRQVTQPVRARLMVTGLAMAAAHLREVAAIEARVPLGEWTTVAVTPDDHKGGDRRNLPPPG